MKINHYLKKDLVIYIGNIGTVCDALGTPKLGCFGVRKLVVISWCQMSLFWSLCGPYMAQNLVAFSKLEMLQSLLQTGGDFNESLDSQGLC